MPCMAPMAWCELPLAADHHGAFHPHWWSIGTEPSEPGGPAREKNRPAWIWIAPKKADFCGGIQPSKCWKYMEIYMEKIWKYMEIYGIIWKYIYGNIWKYMEIYGHIWKYMWKTTWKWQMLKFGQQKIWQQPRENTFIEIGHPYLSIFVRNKNDKKLSTSKKSHLLNKSMKQKLTTYNWIYEHMWTLSTVWLFVT